ncbi:DUF5372 family protein [Cystobacter fuscus]|uniref:DUF5372 family protein n=1 Tax=Cystobacter fuscus TaxID=43 RepID=UPI0037BFB6D4
MISTSPHRRTPSLSQWSRNSVVITHPLHPFAGRRLPLLQHIRHLGRPCVVLLFPDGRPAKLPEDWTDLRPWPTPVEFRGKCPKLHPESLRELSALLDDLKHRSQPYDQKSSTSNEKPPRSATAGHALRRTDCGGPARAAGRAGRRAAQGHHRSSLKTRDKR